MRHALDEWMKKASAGRHRLFVPHDRPELPDAGLRTWTRWCATRASPASLFMAYPGVFMVDDATIFRALRRTGATAGSCMHAENGGVIDLLAGSAAAAKAPSTTR
jgi:hypothetical protein